MIKKRRENDSKLLLCLTVWIMHIGWKTHLGSRALGQGFKPHRPAHAYDLLSIPSSPFRNCRRWARRRHRRPTCFDGFEKGCKNYECFFRATAPFRPRSFQPAVYCVAFCYCKAFNSTMASAKGVRRGRSRHFSQLVSGTPHHSSMDAEDDAQCKDFHSHCLPRAGKQN